MYEDRFHVSDDLYLDGNSLGQRSIDAEWAFEGVIEEWRRLEIRDWTDTDPPWFHYGERLGDSNCAIGTPRDANRRGGHVTVEHRRPSGFHERPSNVV